MIFSFFLGHGGVISNTIASSKLMFQYFLVKTKKASKTCFFLWYMCKLFEKRDYSLLQKRKTLQNVSISSKRRFKTCVWFVNVKQIQNYHLPNCFWHNNWKNQKYCCGGGILLESDVFFWKVKITNFGKWRFCT